MQEKKLTDNLKIKESDIEAIDNKELSVGDFKTVYKPSKNKETANAISCDYQWQQSIRVPFAEFPDLKKENIGDKIMIVLVGPAGSMDEKGVTVKVSQMALIHGKPLTSKTRNALPAESFAMPGRKYPINDENHARNALARGSANLSKEEYAKLKAKVKAKFPGIKVGCSKLSKALGGK